MAYTYTVQVTLGAEYTVEASSYEEAENLVTESAYATAEEGSSVTLNNHDGVEIQTVESNDDPIDPDTGIDYQSFPDGNDNSQVAV